MKHDRHLVRLPSKLSTLIRVAVMDTEDAVANGVRIHMGYWMAFDRNERKPCMVCFAGAVLRGAMMSKDPLLDLPDNRNFVMRSDIMDYDLNSKMVALDFVREGRILSALRVMPGNPSFDARLRDHVAFNANRETISLFERRHCKMRVGYIPAAKVPAMCAHFIKVAEFLETLGL